MVGSVLMLPRGLLGAGLLFWGWQVNAFVVGAALGLAMEAARLFGARRFELRDADFTRLSDLTTVVFVVIAGALVATRPVAESVLATLRWMPVVFAPLLLAQFVSTAGRLPLSALMQTVRRRKAREPETPDPPVDLSGIYLATCAVAAGAANTPGLGYFAGLAGLAAWALFARRPRHASLAGWAAAFVAAGALGYGGQAGLLGLQRLLEQWVFDFQLRDMDTDPLRSTTELGSIGRLKLHDAIVLRVHAEQGALQGLDHLHRASFTTYTGTTWQARKSPMSALQPEPDGSTWVLEAAASTPAAAPAAGERRLRLALRLANGKALLALPPGTRRVASLPALTLKRNRLAAVQADLGPGGDWASYVAELAPGMGGYAPPDEEDLTLPAAERPEFERLAAELGLRSVSASAPDDAVRRLHAHFSGYAYSTYRDAAPPAGQTALAHFLRQVRRGHCEYFAAATTLALRAGGIPARYVTGFSVQEYSPLERAYIVRTRHAHAWARAWVNGAWVDVDTTPSSWFNEEAQLGPAWQGIADLFRWALYRWSQRGEFELGAPWIVLLVAVLALLAWRLLRGKRARRAGASPDATSTRHERWTGRDSEFYRVEAQLAAAGHARARNEPLGAWAARVAPALEGGVRERFTAVMQLHERYRFDPLGLDEGERRRLRDGSLALAGAIVAREGLDVG